tara:strand:+ start:1839 stop:2321 length:483 start_codon:yes stop_codon:yes gene_type:complete
MLARFRRKKKYDMMKGGDINIPVQNDNTITPAEAAVKQQNLAEIQLSKKGLAGGRKRKRTRKRFRQYGGEKFICPQSSNASAQGNATMCQSAELLATTQQNNKYNDTSGQQGGRRRRKSKKLKKKHHKRTRKYRKRSNKKRRKRSKKRSNRRKRSNRKRN